jgi:hypothetical protein
LVRLVVLDANVNAEQTDARPARHHRTWTAAQAVIIIDPDAYGSA